MKIRSGAWAVQSFLVCILFGSALAVILYLMADKVLEGMNQWVLPFIGPGAPGMPDELRAAMNNFGKFLTQLREYLIPALALLIASAALPLWFSLFLLGRRQMRIAGVSARKADDQAVTEAKTESVPAPDQSRPE